MNHMEDYLQTEFPHLNVWLTSISEQWAVIAVQGPKSREIIAPLVEGIDMSDEALPHMSVREGKICGVPTRLFRMSFTGERGFEVNVPADYGQAVWEALWAEGQKHGACAYGTEAMHVLRAEKGYIIVGQDTDGTVTPNDAGARLGGRQEEDRFRRHPRPDAARPRRQGRKQLVGLKTKDPKVVLEEGAQIVADPNQPIPMKMIGHVTSSYWSENCGRSIALALVAGGRDAHGRDAVRADAGRRDRGRGLPPWCSSTRRESASMAKAAQGSPRALGRRSPAATSSGHRRQARRAAAGAIASRCARRRLPSRRCRRRSA